MSSVTCKTCTHGNTDSRRWHLDQPASAEWWRARTRWVGRRMLLERASSFSVMAVARLCLAPTARSITHITRADPSASAAFHSLRRHTCAASGLGGSGHVSPAFMSTRASTRKIRFSLIRRRQHKHAIHRPRLHAHPHAQLRLDSHHKVTGARHPLRGLLGLGRDKDPGASTAATRFTSHTDTHVEADARLHVGAPWQAQRDMR